MQNARCGRRYGASCSRWPWSGSSRTECWDTASTPLKTTFAVPGRKSSRTSPERPRPIHPSSRSRNSRLWAMRPAFQSVPQLPLLSWGSAPGRRPDRRRLRATGPPGHAPGKERESLHFVVPVAETDRLCEHPPRCGRSGRRNAGQARLPPAARPAASPPGLFRRRSMPYFNMLHAVWEEMSHHPSWAMSSRPRQGGAA